MTLTLTITNAERLDGDAPLHLTLDGRGAVIGRSAKSDWRLPDPDNYISGRHCEIGFADGGYTLTDLSTNGTMLNGASERMSAPRRIERGDRFRIGRYDIVAMLSRAEDAAVVAPPTPAPPPKKPPVRPKAAKPAPPAPVADAPPKPKPLRTRKPRVATPAEPPLLDTFARAAGVDPAQLVGTPGETLDRAGQLLLTLIAGLVTLVDDRARAKSEMGAEQTAFSAGGNNPLKFARRPDAAVTQLLNPPEAGFMPALAAVEDAFADLQAHQLATLHAMQGALRATLDRFSPTAIEGRAETGGILAKIVPGARAAALWHAYEREFAGVAGGSNDAFMEVFAREFRRAYLDLANRR